MQKNGLVVTILILAIGIAYFTQREREVSIDGFAEYCMSRGSPPVQCECEEAGLNIALDLQEKQIVAFAMRLRRQGVEPDKAAYLKFARQLGLPLNTLQSVKASLEEVHRQVKRDCTYQD